MSLIFNGGIFFAYSRLKRCVLLAKLFENNDNRVKSDEDAIAFLIYNTNKIDMVLFMVAAV